VDSTPGICMNTGECELADVGRPIYIELGDDFRCPKCGVCLVAPGPPASLRPLVVPFLTGTALLLGITGSVAALFVGMWHWTAPTPTTILVDQLWAIPKLSQPAAPVSSQAPSPPPAPIAALPPPAPPIETTTVEVAPPDRPFRPTPIRGGAPPYPASLASDGRPGRVLVKCDILPSGKPAHCTARPDRGGDAFPPVVLSWLQGRAAFAPIRLHGKAVRETHTWRVAVAESPLALSRARRLAMRLPPQPAFNGLPVSSTRPDFPDEYAEQDRHGSVTVNCVIATNGNATDCHAAGGPRFADAVMSWLANPRTKFPPVVRNGQYIPARRTWNVEYIP
jgi:hypothetical protein